MRQPVSAALLLILLCVHETKAGAASSSATGIAPSTTAASPLPSFPSTGGKSKQLVTHSDILRSLEGGMRATRRLPHLLSKPVRPALSSRNGSPCHAIQEVSAMGKLLRVPGTVLQTVRSNSKGFKVPSAGYYYGITPDKMFPHSSQEKGEENVQVILAQTLSETLGELRTMRQELHSLRREMMDMRKKITGEQDLDYLGLDEEDQQVDQEAVRLAQFKRKRRFDRIGKEAERWAHQMLFEEDREGNGFQNVLCNKVIRNTYNADGRTSVYLGWLKDSRGKHADSNDDREYPCLKIYSTVDAPFEDVCEYLAQEENMPKYNAVITRNRDLEEISSSSKICWATSPQLLFLKPREFVTFVTHKWSHDGNTLAVVNQACEHPDAPAVNEEGKEHACRARAIRGANFISRDPDDPSKTRLSIIAHAAPGGLPQWASKTAVNAMAPIEPFKLFHNINVNVQHAKPELEAQRLERAQEVSESGVSTRPAGMSQIGYAAFWPQGGAPLPQRTQDEHENPENDHASISATPTAQGQGPPHDGGTIMLQSPKQHAEETVAAPSAVAAQ